MPVVGQKDPGGEQEAMAPPGRLNGFGKLLKIHLRQQTSAAGQPAGHKEVVIRQMEPPQTGHRISRARLTGQPLVAQTCALCRSAALKVADEYESD